MADFNNAGGFESNNKSVLNKLENLDDWKSLERNDTIGIVSSCVFIIVVVFGIVFNLAALVIMIRHRIWLQHEGYIYLMAIFVSNIVTVTLLYFPHWLEMFRQYYDIAIVCSATCKIWRFLISITYMAGWFVVALLVDICLRDHLTERDRWVWCHRLSVRYCSLLASKVTVGLISGAFVLLSAWRFYLAVLVHIDYDTIIIKFCSISKGWFSTYMMWETASLSILWYIPVIIIIPVIWTVTLCSQKFRRSEFALFLITEDEEDADGFVRASLFVSAFVLILQFPHCVIFAILSFQHFSWVLYEAEGIAHLIFATNFVFVPVVFLVALRKMRTEIKAAVTGKCCSRDRNRVEDVINAILPLDDFQGPSISGF